MFWSTIYLFSFIHNSLLLVSQSSLYFTPSYFPSQTLKQNSSRLENRTQLVQLCHMGPKVFINCGGFIMIDTNQLGDT